MTNHSIAFLDGELGQLHRLGYDTTLTTHHPYSSSIVGLGCLLARMARQYAARYLGSYLVLGTFLLMMFIFGVGDEMKLRFGVLQMGLDDGVTLASSVLF